MVSRELCSRNTPGPLTQHPQPGKCADGYCTSRKWSGSLTKEFWAASWSFLELPNINLSQNFTYGTPGSQNPSALVERFVRSLCRVSAREVLWVGLRRRSGPPKNKMLL